MPRIVHFEIYADDVDRAEKFYSDIFGWSVNRFDGPADIDYRLATTGTEGPGIDGAIMKRPHQGVAGMNYIEVDSIDTYASNIRSGGGKVLQPKFAVPGVGWVAVCLDTEDNPLGLFQSDESAS